MPEIIPTMAADRFLFAFQQMGVGQFMIQLDLTFPHHLDPDRLRRAYLLTLEAHPVLGCRFVPDPRTPWWEPAEPAPDAFTVTSDPAAAESFLIAGIDHISAPQLRACLLQGPDRDRLILKISHCAGDTGGLKEASAGMAETYRRLAADPSYQPPVCRGSRSYLQVTDRVPLSAWPRIFWHFLAQSWQLNFPRPTHTWPLAATGPDQPQGYMVRELTPEHGRRMADWGRARGATINDIVIAAYFRAQASAGGWDGRARLRLQTTIDLRRWYLPDQRGEEICNLSAYFYPRIGRELGATLADTVAHVAASTRAQKKNWPGLTDICLGPIFRRLSLSANEWAARAIFEHMRGTFPNGLTNLGPISPEHVDYDGLPSRALIHPPTVVVPVLVGGVSGYNGGIALSFGAPEYRRPEIQRFLDALVAELATAAGER